MSNVPKLRFKEFSGEWIDKTLGDIYKDLKTGSTPSRLKKEYFKGENLWITSGELNYGYINNTIEKISDKAVKDTNLRLYPAGTFFIAITGLEAPGTRGKCAINALPATTNQSCLAFYEKDELDTKFLFYWYNKYGIPLYFKYAQGTKQQSFNNKIVENFDILLPSKQEQEKIASFLTSVDTKIVQLTKKEQLLSSYKKGVMQKIFSGEIRFKADDGSEFCDWEEKKLGDVFSGIKGQGLSKGDIIEEGDNKCILYGELYTTYSEIIKEVISKTNSTNGVKSLKGDLLIPCSTTTTGIDLADVTALYEDNVLLGGDITILRFKKKGNSTFFAYYLTHHKKHDLAKYGQGSTIVHMYYSHFKTMIIKFPPSIEEQTKIANFLSSIDSKIEQVQKQLASTKEFKKALLQQMFV